MQTNIVRTQRQPLGADHDTEAGGASTLSVVNEVKQLLPKIAATLPTSLSITQLFDQSVFVRASVSGVVREALIAAFLTAMMILLFLGSWRSTLIVCLSIPLSILTSIIVLGLLGQTINVMTLGGLALAVGILVDDATVEIENVHRNMGISGKTLVRAILDGAQQIALPAFVSTFCICIVFVPVLMLSGAAKYLFTPLAMAVVFAMMTSYLLTRTIVPTLVHYLLPAEMALYQEEEEGRGCPIGGDVWHIHDHSSAVSKLCHAYRELADLGAGSPGRSGGAFGVFVPASFGLVVLIGQDFFPYVDAGQLRLHVRVPPDSHRRGRTRLRRCGSRNSPPDSAAECDSILDNIGLPVPGSTSLYRQRHGRYGDGEILIS